MRADRARLKHLIDLYRNGEILWNDHIEPFELIGNNQNDPLISEFMLTSDDMVKDFQILNKDWAPVYEKISNKTFQKDSSEILGSGTRINQVHFLKSKWLKYVAAVLLILSVVGYFVFNKRIDNNKTLTIENNIRPGTNKAVLTLSDGRKITLDNSVSESIADGNISIEKSNGALTYNSVPTSATGASPKVAFNTMTTPRGGQYQIILPDGSKVWMNSDSYLKYPTVFTGKTRQVQLSGEAYFDIVENKEMPFIVESNNVEITVLGTIFNVNSYNNEPEILATLVNGSIKVKSGSQSKIVKPNQQVQIVRTKPDEIKLNTDADVSRIIAWQNGLFEFSSADLPTIARQLSRWYDVDITAEKGNRNFKFSGGINKRTPIKDVLKILNANGVTYRWEQGILKLYTE